MFKEKIITLIYIFILFQYSICTAQATDSVKQEINDPAILNFSSNLDSLLDLWYVKSSLTNNKQDTNIISSVDFDKIPDSVFIKRLQSLPSLIDLTYNRTVRNYIKMYLVDKKDLVEVMLGLSEYYFPIFEDILDKKGLPVELEYLSIIESALNPRAVSWTGATGVWQFMYGTGRMYKLTINSYVDERRDPVRASIAAANFLSDLYDMFDDWTLAMAAYNCGPGNVNKAIRRSGGKRSFWDIYYFLPRETRGYVPAYIAASYVMNFYDKHGIYPIKTNLPMFTDTIKINDQLYLKQVAKVLNIPINQLRDLNPQYKQDIIPGKYSNCYLKIPNSYITNFIDLQDSIFAYNDSIFFNPLKTVTTPKYTTSYYDYQPPPNSTKLYYTIKTGDNLGYIASWYNVGLSKLRYWNHIYRNTIRSGKKLIVYVPNNKVNYYKKINTMSFNAKQRMIGRPIVTKKPETQVNTSSTDNYSGEYIYYTVRYGDTIWDIAKKYSDVTDTDILRLNNITDTRKISPGQVLKIKRKS